MLGTVCAYDSQDRDRRNHNQRRTRSTSAGAEDVRPARAETEGYDGFGIGGGEVRIVARGGYRRGLDQCCARVVRRSRSLADDGCQSQAGGAHGWVLDGKLPLPFITHHPTV